MDIMPFMQMYLSTEETYESGDIIIEEGSRGNWVYVVLAGQVKVTKRTEVGIVTMDTLKQGAVFGEMAMLGKFMDGRSASVIAADGPVKLGVLNFELLRRDYDSLSPQLKLLIDALIVRLKECNERAAAFVVAANPKNRGEK
ncbi:MAG: cyclic nucleotide-binding domain-containing protein [Deltaproteobacteria bacterium]|nr:cyclic nucleotide-binding domain-containing protein [Deltaproteobacteria bacterium]